MVLIPWYARMVCFRGRANTSVRLKPDPCRMESASVLWNIRSCKRIEDETTETSHVDQPKVRTRACIRPRDRFGRNGRP